MLDHRWHRSLLLALLGMGTFFLIAALLSLLTWFAAGEWRSFLMEITFVAGLASIPTAYHLWSSYVVHHL